MLNFPSFFNAQAGGYEIEQSLRIAQGSYLYRTNSSSGNVYTWTYSCWVKRGTFTQAIDAILAANQNYGNDWNSDSLQFHTGNSGLQIYNNRNQSIRASGTTNAKYRDPSAWMHIVAVWDNTNSTAADKFRYYINGERATIAWNTTPTGDSSLINSTTTMRIGQNASVNSEKYMAEVHFIDGTAVTNANDFGEYDDNGVWRPIEYTGSYGTNGFYLKFDPSATNGVGHDHSGNGNNWSLQNIVTSGTGTDVMSDTPTTNWCTLNPVGSTAASQCSNGNLEYYNGTTSTWRSGVSTFAVSSGKWYFEAKFTSFPASSAAFVGIGPDTIQWVNNVSHFGQGSASGSYGYYSNSGQLYSGGSGSSYGATYTTNDVIGVALDLDAGTLRFYKNGTDQGEAVSGLTGTWNVGVSSLDTPAVVNFGQRDFEQSVPTGFKPLNTSNLTAPTVKDGSDNFNTVLYTGNATGRTITGVGFQADFLWNKLRDTGAQDHLLYDTVRGIGSNGNYVRLRSNTATAEEDPATTNQDLTAFTSDGFTIGTHGALNGNNQAYVTWLWKAGGTGSSNTDGSITSTVSANPTAGFSIVNWTVGSTDNQTVGHGLGVPPDLIITKNRDTAYGWATYHSPLGATKYLTLDTTNAVATNIIAWNNTEPTSTVFTVGDASWWGSSTDSMIAYCFAEVEGYSKMGTYTGSTGFPFVWCGFKPAFILLKPYDLGSGWYMYDAARGEYNVVSMRVLAESPAAETSAAGNDIDILSNGFKLRGASNSGSNYNGVNYIFYAVAENPFGGSGVSPATAR
jgi:hypothetical protein